MRRHDLLRELHELLAPRTYFEIGVNTGESITLSRCPSVAVDPFYKVTAEVRCDLHLVRATSDEFFARARPFAHFETPVIDLAFIDGMHLAEFALRDVINTERYTHAASVIVIDDMLPRNVLEANRNRESVAWAGDVYKMIDSFRSLRPDLVCLEVDTEPTGTVVLLLPDPRSTTLLQAYDELLPDYVVPDPQDVPAEVLGRTRAVRPEDLLGTPIWSELRRLRGRPDDEARPLVSSLLAANGLSAAS